MTAPIETTSEDPIDATALDTLKQSFGGELLRPGDPSYDLHRRVWNGSIDRHPALIARCAGVPDVIASLALARRMSLPVAVRGGGHSFPGLSVCDGGVVIDLGLMKLVKVNPDGCTVRAQAGVVLGELDRATQAFGLAVPTGSVTHTGIAGLTLGGGFGWLMRKYGLTIDQLLSVELVTADGQVVRASETLKLGSVLGSEGRRRQLRHRDRVHVPHASGRADSAVGPAALATRRGPAGDALLPRLGGLRTGRADDRSRTAPSTTVGPHSSSSARSAGRWRCLLLDRPDRPRREGPRADTAVRIASDLIAPRPFVEHQAMLDASFPPGIWIYSKATDVQALSEGVLDVLLAYAARAVSPRSGIIAWQLGGAVARVGETETPFGSRSSGYLVDILGATDSADGFAEEREWAREGWTALTPYHAGVYVNWLMEEGESRVRQAYGERRYARLQELKRRYDPENVFRLNQNIDPV